MRRSPSPLREPVDTSGGDGDDDDDRRKKQRRGWKEGDRDELGESRDGMNPGLLPNQHFSTVDRHLWAAFEQVLRKKTKPSPYCESVMAMARRTRDLAVKKMFVMTLMLTYDDMREYFALRCPPEKFRPWFAELRENMEKFLRGAHREGIRKCEKQTDAVFPSVTAFVAAMTAYYANL